MMDKAQLVSNVARGVALMVERQQAVNMKVDEKWWTLGLRFHRAAWVELGEGMGYLSWEWWKKADGEFKSSAAFGHYCLELVDALHFITSMAMQEVIGQNASKELAEASLPKIASQISDYLGEVSTGCSGHLYHGDLPTSDLPTLTEDAALCCLYKLPKNAYSYVVSAAVKAGIGFHGLLAFYLGKSVLNIFRQEHGYKQGTYRKIWDSDGEEDNLYLAHGIVTWLKPLTEAEIYERIFNGQFTAEITGILEQHYSSLTGASSEG